MKQTHYGSIFALITLFLLLGLFFLWTQNYLDPNSNMTIQNDGQELVITAKNKHYYASGTINDTPVTFIIDTGASQIAVNERIARQAGLVRGTPITLSTANGEVTGNSTTITNLALGNIHVQNIHAVIMPNMDDEVLLGMNFLSRFNLRQTNNQLILELR